MYNPTNLAGADSVDSDDLELADDLEESADAADYSELLASVEVQTASQQGRERQISAKIQINHSVESIWQVLTDYESLANFIPNLQVSRRLTHPDGGIRLEQIGTQKLMRLNFSARVVLDLEEHYPHQIDFTMVDGDFKSFAGFWRLDCATPHSLQTALIYVVQVLPKRTMPVGFIERRIRRDLPFNLIAIQQRVNQLFGSR
jgi:ribosome-associated toxin RatA of RatAB toxin-antitoxin module